MTNPPRATYRIQFHAGFTFADALAIVPYLARLGVSHVYASPVLAARPRSTHGYDVIDPTRLNPELGADADFDRLTSALREHGMSIVLDIVPNHMAATEINPWFNDVLANGRESPYAKFFDIAWDEEDGKIVLPTLGAPLDQTIDEGHIARDGNALRVYDRQLPLAPGTPETSLGDILAHQHYRLAYWRETLPNYRRFFEISDLIGLRVEDPDVFEATHSLVFRLLAEERIDGVRIDHIDGLRDPLAYLRRLRERANEAKGAGAYILVEKILGDGEPLPDDWPVDGTTGYDFLGQANGLFVDGHGLRSLTTTYRQFTGDATPLHDILYRRKHAILAARFERELRWLSRTFARTAGLDEAIAYDTILELSACLPVYRTYITAEGASQADAHHLAIAAEQAIASDADPEAVERLRDLTLASPNSNPSPSTGTGPSPRRGTMLAPERSPLTDTPPNQPGAPRSDLSGATDPDALEFTLRWQQLTGPAMAKGLEDSTFYRYNRLISLNEVGGHSEAVTPAAFHRFIRNRARRWPNAMNGTSTHDTKRSEDARMRLAGLAEEPRVWTAAVRELAQTARDSGAPNIDANTEYHLWQAAVGCWPPGSVPSSGPAPSPRGGRLGWGLGDSPQFTSSTPNQADAQTFPSRLTAYLLKAVREAAEHTSWIANDQGYEASVTAFANWLASDPQAAPARMRVDRLVRRLDQSAYKRSLAQLVLKLTAPGVPDIYQGQELWDHSFVDPDNRRPVDYALRARLLDELSQAGITLRDLLRTPTDGRAKLFVTHRLLQLRRDMPDLFASAGYRPLAQRDRSLLAFARHLPSSRLSRSSARPSRESGNPPRSPSTLPSAPANLGSSDGQGQWLIVVITRLFTVNPEQLNIALPAGAPTEWRDVLNGGTLRVREGALPVAKAVRAGSPLVVVPR